MSTIPKVIYFTYKTKPPFYVFKRWKTLNPSYKLDFSLDADCIAFLTQYFTAEIAQLFKTIPIGMYKADLWRICKLYITGGVYADIDLVPYVSVDSLIHDNYTFYSCLCAGKTGIFQAFMITPPKNPLLLQFIFSFLRNKPWNYMNGPTHDMYNCIKRNLDNITLQSDTLYTSNMIKINIYIGTSTTNVKAVTLYNFDQSHEYTFGSSHNNYSYEIRENMLIVTRTDADANSGGANTGGANTGWTDELSVDICINATQTIYLFEEILSRGFFIVNFRGNKILDSRDPTYDTGISFKNNTSLQRYDYLININANYLTRS